MKLHSFKENMEFQIDGIRYRVSEIDPPKVFAVATGNVEEVEFNYFELINQSTFYSADTLIDKALQKREEKRYVSLLDTLDEKQKKIVQDRFDLIEPMLLLGKAKSGDFRALTKLKSRYGQYFEQKTYNKMSQECLIDLVAGVYNLSNRTIKRRLAGYRKEESSLPNQGENGLIPNVFKQNYNRKDCKILEICHPKKTELVLDTIRVKLPDEVVPIIKEVIEKEYLTLKKDTATAVFESIEVKCSKKGVDAPGYDTVYKILKRLSPEIRSRMREGRKGEQAYNEVTRGYSNEEAMFPLHIVEIDHTQLDIDVIDEKSGYVIGRPWITLGMDLFSRMVWCLDVSFEPPSANKVRQALMHGIFFKNVKRKYNTINEWDVYGIPNIIYTDNGPEFKNADVRRMIKETLKSNPQYRPVKTPRYGGTIERLFGTINAQLIHRLAGTRKGSVQEKGDYDSEAEAIFTLEDIRELLTVYITDVYHHQVHKGLPIFSPVPVKRYYDGLKKVGFPEWIDKEDEEFYRMELLPVTFRPYTRDGVRFENIIYKSTSNAKGLVKPREFKYKIKYNHSDVSILHLLDSESGEYIELRPQREMLEETEGLNRYTFTKVLEIMKEKGLLEARKIPGVKSIKVAKEMLAERVQQRAKTRRRERAQATRMNMELPNSRPPAPAKIPKEISVREMLGKLKKKDENIG
ncbi:DDE-type integrase/transposase/recombinase [Paenibacillus sp. LMG 31459]|uniref:DDE-type integrase/transposase/recombinase n=1 Tax=Paenibacillus phytohabitans TaxID=2654978 RepID=A0ABX1YTB1_9BACL|nr:DDE-type integrase/transposase/recombinase [Paenibacillus phytohabitans]NOU84138.1 DDE-type integrase/transposase/recombinase [Paenibacillus phytohabitans]